MSTRNYKSFEFFKKRGLHIGIGEGIWRRLADRQLQRPVGLCRLCRGELYRGDIFWRIEGSLICEDCLDDFARRYFAPWRTTGEDLREGGHERAL